MKLMSLKVLMTCCVLFCRYANAQDWRFQVGDTWFNTHQGLQVGDTMPDIPLGKVINNYTGKTKFSDFKGKLVILDMWSTSCNTCIRNFPEMEKLQKQFGDRIQIFIVNPYQDQKLIEETFKERNENFKARNKAAEKEVYRPYKLPNLPSIVYARELYQLFPARFVPHHIWIDGNGIIRLIGNAKNTYAKKISQVLDGMPVTYLKNGNTTPFFNKEMPYYKILGKQIKPDEVNSFFADFNNDYAVGGSSSIENVVDTQANTVRNTYISNKIGELFFYAFYNSILKEMKRILLAVNTNTYGQLFIKDSVLFNVSDEYSHDDEFMRKRFCYELITPSSFSDQDRRKIMQDDLNKEFGRLFNVHTRVEPRKISCYVLVSKTDKDQIYAKTDDFKIEYFTEYGRKMIRYHSTQLQNVIRERLGEEFIKGLNGEPFILLDETSYKNDKVSLVVPNVIKNIGDLRKALRRNNLDIIKTERVINSMVIRQE